LGIGIFLPGDSYIRDTELLDSLRSSNKIIIGVVEVIPAHLCHATNDAHYRNFSKVPKYSSTSAITSLPPPQRLSSIHIVHVRPCGDLSNAIYKVLPLTELVTVVDAPLMRVRVILS